MDNNTSKTLVSEHLKIDVLELKTPSKEERLTSECLKITHHVNNILANFNVIAKYCDNLIQIVESIQNQSELASFVKQQGEIIKNLACIKEFVDSSYESVSEKKS